MESSLSSRVSDLKRGAVRLKSLASHDALTILRYSLSVPRLMHTLHSSPSFGHPLLSEFDKTLKECLCSVVNTALTDIQRTQASLPVRIGGLGIRLASQLAPSAFLASAMGTRQLQDAILLQCSTTADLTRPCPFGRLATTLMLLQKFHLVARRAGIIRWCSWYTLSSWSLSPMPLTEQDSLLYR